MTERPRHRIRRTPLTFALGLSPVYSAHVCQELEVQYMAPYFRIGQFA